MLFRRLSAHLKAQNWFAVGLDFFIVVFGVFMGLQVQNWNEARADQSREASYLSNLAKDVRSDIIEIDDILHVATVRMSALDRLVTRSTGEELPDGFASARGRIEIEKFPPYSDDDPRTIGIALFILSTLDGNRSAYDTIISTGGIGVIRDVDLVRDIQDYYSLVDKVRHFEVSLEENRVRLVDAEQRAGISPVDETPADELAKLFGESASLTAAVKNYWLYTNRHLKLMNDLRREAEKLVADIESGAT
jgi:uncharacterized protein DUF6090